MNSDSGVTCGRSCGCGSTGRGDAGLARRDFLRILGVGGVGAAVLPSLAMAGPFTRADFEKLVPADKKLSPEWVRSLAERGTRTTYTKTRDELNYIGMPVGGLCAGQLYLGGDGRLWHWDIFNRIPRTGAEHYAKPLSFSSPVGQGFGLRLASAGVKQERALEAAHWKEVSFTGEYPIGFVSYEDPECPVRVDLEAFSPFIPLNVDDSSLPATVLQFSLRNVSRSTVEGEFGGWLENAACLHSGAKRDGVRTTRVLREGGWTFLNHTAQAAPVEAGEARPDIVFADFETETHGDWSASGTAFGRGPIEATALPAYQGDVGAKGKRLISSHSLAPGKDVGEKDGAVGRLTSRTFTIERHYINFLIGGGNHKGKTCLNLLVDGKPVLSATGANDNRMQPSSWDVRGWAGKVGRLEIVDEERGSWGNVGVDEIVFSDRASQPVGPLTEEPDFGSMGLALLDARAQDWGNADLPESGMPGRLFVQPARDTGEKAFGQKLAGALVRKFKLAPGKSVPVTFVLTWCFPNLKMNRLPPGRFYGTRFGSARAVAEYVVRDFDRLTSETRLWHDTWYDSTLPYWFLDRTFLNTSILATSSCYRFGSGRFYSWEGVGCCEGTCGHVWQYAQAVGRLFPELERLLREQVDFGLGLQPDGAIHFRGEFNDIPAIDAQAGAILRALREHQMSADGEFLKRIWPGVKRATEWLMNKDSNGDGLIESNQHNTLDTDWFGPVAWLSGLYLASLLAAEAMARTMGDSDFASRCREIFTKGRENLVSQLFDGEYFRNLVDSRHLDAINSGSGCEIDQVMGQSWAFQVGLPRVLPEPETLAALRSLWRYNFTPDVGPYREVYKPGRWYALPGEAGLLMCSFPRADWDYAQARGKGADWAAGYFNECMNGFEYQVAGHMVWEGLVMKGLAVTRAVHDRYHASRRNPWNEVECGDHYVRSMASYGVYLAACGYEYHGPEGRLAMAPRLTPENFQGAFTAAEGWGSVAQRRTRNAQSNEVRLKYGQLQLNLITVTVEKGRDVRSASVRLGDRRLRARLRQTGSVVEVEMREPVLLRAGEVLEVRSNLS